MSIENIAKFLSEYNTLFTSSLGNWLAVLGLMGICIILFIVITLLLANLEAFFTKQPTKGNTAFLNRGENLHAILPNVGAYRMSHVGDSEGRHWLVQEPNEEARTKAFFYNAMKGTVWFQKLLWNRRGIRFTGPFWPHDHIHTFKVSRKRIRESTDIGGNTDLKDHVVDSPKLSTTLKDRVVDSPEPPMVSSLLFKVPRPIYMEGVELAGDNSRVNLLFLVVYQQVIPVLPVYYYKGDFFPPLDTAFESSIVDFFATHLVAVDKDGNFIEGTYNDKKKKEPNKETGDKGYMSSNLTYSLWIRLKKADGSPMENHLRSLNASNAFYTKLKNWAGKDEQKMELVRELETLTHGLPAELSSEELSKEIGQGIIPRFGLAIISVKLVDWEPHKDTVDLAKALLAKQTKFHLAEGVREEAYGQRDAILARKTGESLRYDSLMEAMVRHHADPNTAAIVLATQVRTENIRDSKVLYYAEGGAPSATSAMVPLSPPTSAPPDK